MDTDTAGVLAANGNDKRPDRPGRSADTNRNNNKPLSRHQPALPLAPLEYQHRGAITDASPKTQSRSPHLDVSHNLHPRNPPAGPRPASPLAAGDSRAQPADSKLSTVANGVVSRPRTGSNLRRGGGKNKKTKESNSIVDTGRADGQAMPKPSGPQGTKRKSDNTTSVAQQQQQQHIDPQLVGPGVSNAITPGELEGPPQKRRSSTEKAPQYDRRNSADARAGATGPSGAPFYTWIGGSATNNMVTGPPPTSLPPHPAAPYPVGVAFPGMPPHGRPAGIATFTWPTQSPDAMHPDPNKHIPGPRPFDPSAPLMQMMPTVNFTTDRRMTTTDNGPMPVSTGPTRALRSRSRPPSRGLTQMRGADQAISDHASPQVVSHDDASSSGGKEDGGAGGSRQTPYSRSPELRVSHKLAERKRRKEMKDLFDELRDQLPQDRGMKASKWEILSKAIDFIVTMKQSHTDMSRDMEMLRHEVEAYRQGLPFHPGGPPPQVMFGQHVVSTPFPPPPPGQSIPHHSHPPHPGPPPPGQQQQQQPLPGNQPSRPGSSQNSFPPGNGPNGNVESRTGTPSS